MRGRMMALMAAGIVAVAGGAMSAIAQERQAEAAAKPAPTGNPSLSGYERGVRDESRRLDFALRRLDVDAVVHGAIAEVTLDMAFAGRGKENGEAWLHVDMPAGAVVTGYALDIDGKLVDGVLVDQQKAKEAYERQVRGRVDPGIAEVDRTGGLNLRVFPVDPVKGRQVRVRFTAPVGEAMTLPLRTAEGSGQWSVRVRAAEGNPDASLDGQRFDRDGGSLVASGNGALDTKLVVRPQPAAALASRHPLTGETFWQVSGVLPEASGPARGRLRIYWDRSRSMRDVDLKAVLPRLAGAIEALKPEGIELVAFNATGAKRSEVFAGAPLERAIRSLTYAGASSFAPLRNEAKAESCILVSDGRQTLDPLDNWHPPCRLFAIPAGPQADQAAMAALADRNGGKVVTGAGDFGSATVERVTDAGGRALDFASLPAPADTYRIVFQNPRGGPVRIVAGGRESNVGVPSGSASFGGEGALVAARQLGRVESEKGREAFVTFSRRYSVASPTLSFIVLEQPGDYVRYDIEPPADYAQMADYRSQRTEADKAAAERKGDRFDDLLDAWKEEVAWWEKKFDPNAKPGGGRRNGRAYAPVAAPPPTPPPPAIEAPLAPGTQRCPDGSVIASGAACPPPPPPPPPPEPERDSDEGIMEDSSSDRDSVVVTGSRISRPDLEAPSPVTTVDSEQFDLTGTVTVDTLLNELPQLIPGLTETSFDKKFGDYERRYGDLPVFYFDSADWLYQRKRVDEAVETLLSALELPDADSRTIGIVAARLQRWGKLDLAVELRERQVALEPSRPQATRLLALALAERARRNGRNAKADYQRAIELLVGIALSDVADDWDGIDMITLREANALLPRLRALGGDVAIDPRLVKNLTADVRVVLDWTVDNVDLDLWVDEPNGERAMYSNQETEIGGKMSNDMTNGFGPEDYWLRRAPVGTFSVRTNNFRSDAIDPNGRPRLHVRLIRNFGRPNESEESIDVDAKQSKQSGNDPEKATAIGTITIGRK